MNSLRILNLEDDADDAELNAELLSARWPECELVRVDNRHDFLSALEQGDFDVILSDFTMPNFDGRTALTLAHKIRPEIPFLFVSGTIGEDVAIEALKSGATDYVLKNRPIRLIPAVDRALREARDRVTLKWAEEVIRYSEYKYRTLFESLGDAVFLTDAQTEKIIDANKRAEVLLGYNRAELLGQKLSRFLMLENTNFKGGDETSEASPIEYELIRVDGITVPVELRTTQLELYDRALILRLCHELNTNKKSLREKQAS